MAESRELQIPPLFDRNSTELPDPDRFTEGVIIPVDKPSGWSSFDVVKFVRNRLPVRKAGHAGTLDPKATGLLILCVGKATKTVSRIQELEKVYEAVIRLGATTPTYDTESKITDTSSWHHITEKRVREVLFGQFTGNIKQVPPAYSALRKEGARFYELARKGVNIRPEPRNVSVHHIELLDMKLPDIHLRLTCSKGFYVRSLAYDLGIALDSLGYLLNLRRTSIGPFDIQTAWSIEEIKMWGDHG